MKLEINSIQSLKLIKETIITDLIKETESIQSENNTNYINNKYREEYYNILILCTKIASGITDYTEILESSIPEKKIYTIIFKDILLLLFTQFVEEKNDRISFAEVSAISVRYGNTLKVAINRLNNDTLEAVKEEFINMCIEKNNSVEIVKSILFTKLVVMVSGNSAETREIEFKLQ